MEQLQKTIEYIKLLKENTQEGEVKQELENLYLKLMQLKHIYPIEP